MNRGCDNHLSQQPATQPTCSQTTPSTPNHSPNTPTKPKPPTLQPATSEQPTRTTSGHDPANQSKTSADASAKQHKSCVDHTVPWSRVRLSVIENFTVTNASTNLQKFDHILGPTALQKWLEYHETTRKSLEAAALEFRWPTDMDLTRNVLMRQYESAATRGLQWDPIGVSTASSDDIETCIAMLQNYASA